jgi:hypothetical protein
MPGATRLRGATHTNLSKSDGQVSPNRCGTPHLALKDELNRMYREVAGTTRTADPLHPINEQPNGSKTVRVADSDDPLRFGEKADSQATWSGRRIFSECGNLGPKESE